MKARRVFSATTMMAALVIGCASETDLTTDAEADQAETTLLANADAEVLLDEALAEAKATERAVLVHFSAPG